MHAAVNTPPRLIQFANPPVPMVAGPVYADGVHLPTTIAEEPSHIHIPRPSRVLRPDAAPRKEERR
jgi:hypothetical protein